MVEPQTPPSSPIAGPAVGPGRGEPEIHVMPERYRGTALRAKIPAAGPPAPTSALIQTPGKPTGPARSLLIAGGILLALLGVVAAAFLWPRRPSPSTSPPPAPSVLPPAASESVTSTSEVATSTTVATTTPVVIPGAPIPSSVDSDADGLTDLEETEIYHTDPHNPDTDGDGYPDGHEVLYLYNPSGIAPVLLKSSEAVRVYDDADHGFSILVPVGWTVQPLVGGAKFVGQTSESVEVTVQANPLNLSVVEWYLSRFPGIARSELVPFTSRTGGLLGIKAPDGLSAYFATSSRVEAVTYGVVGGSAPSYRRTWEMMVTGFSRLPVGGTSAASGSAATSTDAATSTATTKTTSTAPVKTTGTPAVKSTSTPPTKTTSTPTPGGLSATGTSATGTP